MKTLHSSDFSDFVWELQDLIDKYVGENGDVMWGTENGWTEFQISIPRDPSESEEEWA